MDFFEKAHVVKKDSSRKEHKSEEALKKKIKQMLFGYKQHDSKLIKTCDDTFNPNRLIEETSSVSGYSDLNLTNSSNEDDIVAAVGSDEAALNDSDPEDSISVEEQDSNYGEDNTSSENATEPGMDSNSDNDDKILALSDNLSAQTLESHSDSSDSISFDSSLDVPTTDTDSEEFDADGELADKILESLQEKGVIKTKQPKKDIKAEKGKKRKFNVKEESGITKEVNKSEAKINKELKQFEDTDRKHNEVYQFAHKENVKPKKPKQGTDDVDGLSCPDKIRKKNKKGNKIEESFDNSLSDSHSSEFVSLTVTDMPMQSFSDLVGEYRHPTVRNLPESHNLSTTINSDLFSRDYTTVEDTTAQESENNSLKNNVQTSDSDEALRADLSEDSESPSKYTSVYDDTGISEDTTEKDVSVESENTRSVNPIKVYDGKYSCIFVLKHPAELYIHGKVVAQALGGGTIELCGHILQQEPLEIYAPNNNFAFCLKTVGKEKAYGGSLTTKLVSEGLSEDQAKDIIIHLDDFDAVVSFKKLKNHKIDFVENNVRPTDLFSKVSKNVDNCFKKASEKLGCSFYITRPYRAFEELSCREEIIDCGSEEQSRGLITGGKGVGKSTFLRYCVNRLVSRGPVLLVDLDPGQAECTVAGNISATVIDKPLLGPNFTHLKTPNMMLNLGMISTMDNPRRYVNAIKALIGHCNTDKQLKSMPWLINTMGMTNAMGLKFITLVILQTRPTYLVQINIRNQKKNFETLLNPQNVKNLFDGSFHRDYLFRNVRCSDLNYSFFVENYVDGSIKSNTSLAPRDERYFSFLAYFGQLLSSLNQNGLLGVRPYEVNLADLHIGLNVRIDDDAVTKVINGKIIALCQLTTVDYRGKMFTLRDKPLVCLGHGLIRGIDLEKKTLYVITPTPADKLALVDTLVYADWVPELRGQEKHLPEGIAVPYRTDTSYQKRQLMFAPKRRFNPLQLLKMSRNT